MSYLITLKLINTITYVTSRHTVRTESGMGICHLRGLCDLWSITSVYLATNTVVQAVKPKKKKFSYSLSHSSAKIHLNLIV